MAHNFNQVLDNLSFYQTSKQKESSWLSKMWKNDKVEEQSSFIGNLSASIKSKTTSGLNILNSAAERTARLKNFFILAGVSVLLFLFSFSFLPMILLFPQKFAILFSLGSLVMQAALSYLKPSAWDYIQALFSKENTLVSGLYFGSMFFTIYAAGIMGSYVIVLIACGIQTFAILWYVFSMFPGGRSGFLSIVKYSLKICPCGDSLLPI
jgi:Got1/Sft2-like family